MAWYSPILRRRFSGFTHYISPICSLIPLTPGSTSEVLQTTLSTASGGLLTKSSDEPIVLHLETFCGIPSASPSSDDLLTKYSTVSEDVPTQSSDDPMSLALGEFFNQIFSNFSNFCWAKGNLPLLADLSWLSEAHVATYRLCHYIFMAHSGPCCNQSSDTIM